MYLALDPGTQAAGELPRAGRVRVANSLPDVNSGRGARVAGHRYARLPRVLVNAGGQAFHDDQAADTAQTAAQDLRETLKRFEPSARDGRKLTAAGRAPARTSGGSMHNFQELSTALARTDRQLASLVDSPTPTSTLRLEEAALREALQLFPGALDQTETTLRRRARWPPSWAPRSSNCARLPATSARAAKRPGPSSARPRRSSATRSGPSHATCSPRCATCAAPARTWPWSRRG